MLVLTRKQGQTITIGDDIHIKIMEIKSGQVKLGIDAPKNVPIYREEIYLKVKEENILAARAGVPDLQRVTDAWLTHGGRKDDHES